MPSPGVGADINLIHPEEPSYYLVVMMADGKREQRQRTLFAHSEAMACAEELQRAGRRVRVMHLFGGNSYEVDSYPLR